MARASVYVPSLFIFTSGLVVALDLASTLFDGDGKSGVWLKIETARVEFALLSFATTLGTARRRRGSVRVVPAVAVLKDSRSFICSQVQNRKKDSSQ